MAKFSEDWCYEVLRRARWPNGIICPYCGRTHITTHSRFGSTSSRRYLCLGCRKTFTDLTKTPFARTNLPLHKWFLCLDLMEDELTICQLAKKLRVKWDTTVYMQQRLNAQLKLEVMQRLCEAARKGRFRKLRVTAIET